MDLRVRVAGIGPGVDGIGRRCLILRDRQAFGEWREAMARLAESQAAGKKIVQHPDWIDYELSMRGDSASPFLALVIDGDELIGYAPFLRQHGVLGAPLGNWHVPLRRGSFLRLLGTDVVASPEHVAEVRVAVAQCLDADGHVLQIRETPMPSGLVDAICHGRSGYRMIRSNPAEQFIFGISPVSSVDDYIRGFSSKRRKSLMSRSRTLRNRVSGEVSVQAFEREEEVPGYCELLDRVYRKSWHEKVLSIDWKGDLLKGCLGTLAREQHLLGYLMLIDGQPVAYVHGYRYGDVYEVENIGYDDAYAEHGVGSVLVFEAVLDVLGRHPGMGIDFGYGDNVYKRVLSNTMQPAASIYMARGMTARWMAAGFSAVRTMRRIALPIRARLRKMRTAAPAAGESG